MDTTYFTKKTYGEKLLDPRWQKKRLGILNSANWTCQYCGETESTLHVHHLSYIKGDPWDIEDWCLLCLCEDCHTVSHLNNLTPLEKAIIDDVQLWGLMSNGNDRSHSLLVKSMNINILKYKR